jgi:hypothetical protein
LAQFEPDEERLFYRLIPKVDDFGRYDGRLPILRALGGGRVDQGLDLQHERAHLLVGGVLEVLGALRGLAGGIPRRHRLGLGVGGRIERHGEMGLRDGCHGSPPCDGCMMV